jgi:hypothetical protein
MSFNNKSSFGHGKSKHADAVDKTTPFGASISQLKGLYDRLTHFIRHELIPEHFSNEDIRKRFFPDETPTDDVYTLRFLGLERLLEIFNPIDEDVYFLKWVGSDLISKMKIICWFMGVKIADENWLDVDSFTKPNRDPSKPADKIFDLPTYIYKCLKHSFNDAIDRKDSSSCIKLDIVPKHGDLDFLVNVKLLTYREEFNSDNIGKTIEILDNKIAEAEKREEQEYLTEYEEVVSKYASRLRGFCENLKKRAALAGITLPNLSEDLFQVYAEMAYDAKYFGVTELGDGVTECTTEKIKEDLFMKLRITIVDGKIIPVKCGQCIENQMQCGLHLTHEQATKTASSSNTIGAGCV